MLFPNINMVFPRSRQLNPFFLHSSFGIIKYYIHLKRQPTGSLLATFRLPRL
jgi:hypothetical protein